MKTILEKIYFRSNGTECSNKVLNAKAVKAYIEEVKTQTLGSTPIKYFLRG